MFDPYDVLVQLRDRLSQNVNLNTCKIGIETGLSPDDYPMIRLVPVRFKRLDTVRMHMELLVYFGMNQVESDNSLEVLYQELLTMDELIKDTLKVGNQFMIKHLETITDEDRLDHFKLFASRFEIVG